MLVGMSRTVKHALLSIGTPGEGSGLGNLVKGVKLTAEPKTLEIEDEDFPEFTQSKFYV